MTFGYSVPSNKSDEPDGGPDLIFGAPAIARWVFGSDAPSNQKQVYYRARQFRESSGRYGMPISRVGSTLVLSKKRFRYWLSKAFFG